MMAKWHGVLLLLLCVCLVTKVPAITIEELTSEFAIHFREFTKGAIDTQTGGRMGNLNNAIYALGRQVMLLQLFVEERIRSSGDSGLKQIRHTTAGTRPYFSPSHSGRSLASIHDHSNNIRTVGMGEVIAVLNGVEFRTRHNDYRLYMPAKNSTDYHDVDNVPFPDIPPAVEELADVNEQVKEMRQWFKAWATQNTTLRDYRPYFKPLLCYMEGAWTTSHNLEEPFDSDRHFLDSSSWFDLQEKIRYTSYTGAMSNLENFAYLPTSIIKLHNKTTPEIAQWNYRILCHPINRDIPFNRLRLVDDLAVRMAERRTEKEQLPTRSARFQLNPYDQDEWIEGRKECGLLDELMAEIPGKDNYMANLTDDSFDSYALPCDKEKDENLNVGFYHRMFRSKHRGAMGTTERHRGFADENVFMARTTQPKIASMSATQCRWGRCNTYEQKWSYAIPLEIIYLTPIAKWNPYNLEYKGDSRTESAQTVTANGRSGETTPELAYNGTNSKVYYLTPTEFYSGIEVGRDAADTSRDVSGVLDRQGTMRLVRAAGTRITMPFIHGVGQLRQRYPIMSVHGEGSAVWKELEALKDIALRPVSHFHMYREPWRAGCSSTDIVTDTGITLVTGPSKTVNGTPHTHTLYLSADEMALLTDAGKYVTELTDTSKGHAHILKIKYNLLSSGSGGFYVIAKCDGHWLCHDGHPGTLLRQKEE